MLLEKTMINYEKQKRPVDFILSGMRLLDTVISNISDSLYSELPKIAKKSDRADRGRLNKVLNEKIVELITLDYRQIYFTFIPKPVMISV